MTITIDGTEISGATIDGTDVQEITIDGTVAWVVYDPNIYLGYEGGNNIEKLNSSGSNVWTYSEGSVVKNISVDNEGYIYSITSDGQIEKIDNNGNGVWSLGAFAYSGWDIEVDKDGLIYATGSSREWFSFASTYQYDSKVKIISSSGDIVTSKTLIASGSTNSEVEIKGLAVDANGYVYVGGISSVMKLDNNLNSQWEYTNHSNTVTDVAVDIDGYVYSTSLDQTVHKINSSGSNNWIYYGFEGDVRNVAVDINGYVYAVGTHDYGQFTTQAVAKINSSKDLVWKEGGSIDIGIPTLVEVDKDGCVYVAGYNSGQYFDYPYVYKFNSDSSVIWKNTSFTDGNYINGLAVDPGTYGAGHWS